MARFRKNVNCMHGRKAALLRRCLVALSNALQWKNNKKVLRDMQKAAFVINVFSRVDDFSVESWINYGQVRVKYAATVF